MKYTTLEVIFSAAALLLCIPLVSTQQAQYTPEYIGCYKSIPGFGSKSTFQWQSSGHCAGVCVAQKVPYSALMAGGTCFCGSAIPDDSQKVSESECNTPCFGFGTQTCGGASAYGIWTDGLTNYTGTTGVNTATGSAPTTQAASTTTTQAPSVITEAGHTIVVTAPGQIPTISSASSTGSSSSGPPTAAIAAGIVVGIVGLSAIVGAAFFFIRRQKRRAIEEEYRRNAALNNFVEGGKKPTSSSSMSNSRWDGDFMAERRQSNGSIADDEDFSRRILKVTNPDR